MKGTRIEGLRPRCSLGMVTRILVDFNRFGVFCVSFRSNRLLARQTLSLIFTISTVCPLRRSADRWVNAFRCLVDLFAVRQADFDDIERRFSLVTLSLSVPFPLWLAVSLHSGIVFALSTVLPIGPFSSVQTLSRGAPRTLLPTYQFIPDLPGAQRKCSCWQVSNNDAGRITSRLQAWNLPVLRKSEKT
jgi:hypothetical protein